VREEEAEAAWFLFDGGGLGDEGRPVGSAPGDRVVARAAVRAGEGSGL